MIDEKAPRTLAQTVAPNLTQLFSEAAPNIRKAQSQGGVGAGLGQTVREMASFPVATVKDTLGAGNALIANVAEPIIRPAAQALKTAVTGDPTSIAPAQPQVQSQGPVKPITGLPAPVAPSAPAAAVASPTAALVESPPATRINESMGPDYSWMARNAEAQKKADAEKKAYDATPQGMIEANQARLAAQMQAAGDAVPQSKAANTGVGWIDALVNNRNMNRDREAKLKAQSPFLQAQAQGSGDTIRSLLTQADPLHQAQTKTAQQAGATGDLVAKTQVIFADPNATEDQKKEAAITLRDLAGKGEGSKIASYDTLAPDGMTVLKKASIVGDRGTVDAEAATNATAAAATAKRYAQATKTPAGLASLNKEHLAAVNKRAAGDPAKRASLLVEMNKHRAEHNLPPLQ